MADVNDRAVRSTAAIAGHPLHPMIVPFPIAFLVGALVTDIVFLRGAGDPFWARASEWLLGAGLVMGALAAVLGLIDFLTIERARSLAAAWVHFLGNALVLALSLWNLLERTNAATLTVTETGVVLSAIVVAMLLVTGWLGGEMAYRHRIGVVELEGSGAVASGRAAYDREYVDPRSPAARSQPRPAQRDTDETRRKA